MGIGGIMTNSGTNKLVLGTVQLGMPYGINNTTGQPDKEETFAILSAAWDSGIRLLDTADAYGVSTALIGEFHAATQQSATNKKLFRIITKFHYDNTVNLEQKAHETLTKLSVPSLYCYQFHRCSDVKTYPEAHKPLLRLQNEGLVERIGVSVYTNEEFAEAIQSPIINVIQFPFNLLDNMNFRGELIHRAKESGKELHTRSVFLQGLFFKPQGDFPPSLRSLAQPIMTLQTLSQNLVVTITQLALAYVLSQKLIDYTLFGVETLRQLTEIIEASETFIDAQTLQTIEQIVVKNPDLLNPARWK